MYELYELLYDLLVPQWLVRAVETLVSARLIQTMILGTLIHSVGLFLWHGFQLLSRFQAPGSHTRAMVSPFWRVAALAIAGVAVNTGEAVDTLPGATVPDVGDDGDVLPLGTDLELVRAGEVAHEP